MNSFPYPVLQSESSGYKDDCKFALTFIENAFENNNSKIKLYLYLKSQTLEDLIKTNRAKIIIKARSGISIFKTDVSEYNCNHYIEVPLEEVKNVDYVTIESLIISTSNQIIEFKDDIKDIYGNNFAFKAIKGTKLAVSNSERLFFKSESIDFIKLNPTDEIKSGFTISLNNPNYIKINISKELNKAYTKCKSNKNKHANDLAIFGSNLIFETIVYTLFEILSDDSLDQKEWFRQFKYAFNSTGTDLDDFIQDNRDEIHIDKIYEIAHKITNNQISSSLIKASNSEE